LGEWWHNKELPQDSFATSHEILGSSGAGIEALLKRTLGGFGAILFRYGLADARGDGLWAWGASANNPTYKYGYNWPKEIVDRRVAYKELYKCLVDANTALRQLRAEKARKDVSDLWDEA
jgi:hypothetical protein